MTSEPLSQGVDPTLPPRFFEMGEYPFQRFITDLFAYEPDIATSSEYGVRGQADDGADVIAQRNRGDGQEIASCKCYQQASASEIRKWSDEFLEHWDEHWKIEGIRRFVLATTALNSANRAVQDQVILERKRFAALGVIYEMWGPSTLLVKVRPHRTVAATYLGPTWTDQICGAVAPLGLATSSSAGLVSAALIGQVAELQERLSAQALLAADRAHEDLRAGRSAAVQSFIDEQRHEANWSQLDARTQARLLRLAASLALQNEDVSEAQTLALAADGITLADEPLLAAHIELERNGPSPALTVLGEISSKTGLQMRCALRAMTADLDGARRDFDTLRGIDPDDPETIRLEALVALASGNPRAALMPMRRAEAAAPERIAVRQLGAMVRYACALSPAIGPDWYLSPNALDGAFVREDLESQLLLEEALTFLDLLVASLPHAVHVRVWRLAILASTRSRRERAREEAAELLVLSDQDPTVVAWCLFRAIDIDLSESERVLTERYEAGADQATVRVLGFLLARRENATSEVALLRGGLGRQNGDARAEAIAWIKRLGGELPDSDRAEVTESAQYPLGTVRLSNDWPMMGKRLKDLLSSRPPNPEALALAEETASAGHFELLAPHVDALLSFRTATAVRIAAHTAYRAGDAGRLLTILDEEAPAFGEALPPDMRRLRVEALAQTGNVRAALREADLVASSGSVVDRLFRAQHMSATGNVRGAITAVREALDAGLLYGDKAFHWSRMMRAEEPVLARRLLEQAIATDLNDRLVVAAMHDAFSLQLKAELDPLIARVHARAVSGAEDVRLFTADDLPALIAEQRARATETEQLYLNGSIPVHLLLADDPVQFALLHLGPNLRADGSMRPWALRHGARPPFVEYEEPWSAWRLHMDISALLVATRLELLDLIESHPNGVEIPADTPLLLLSMETGCRERSNSAEAERVLAVPLRPAGLDSIEALQVIAGDRQVAVDEGRSPSRLHLRALVGALVARQALNADVAQRITNGLPPSDDEAPADGATLLLDAGSLRRLAAFDALSIVVERFDVRCDGDLLDQARWAKEEAFSALNAAGALSQLRARIATGLESGIYRLIPRANLTRGEIEDERATDETPIGRCFTDVISASAPSGAMAWIDDRMVTGYPRAGSMPVIGVNEVLEALRREGHITATRQRAALNTLRAAGALFLAPTAEELCAALLPAPYRGQQIVETPALAIIRRSLAHSALHEHHLAIDQTSGDERPSEYLSMQIAMRLLANCLKEIWLNDGLSFDQRIALADWLWLNARRTHVGRRLANESQEVGQNTFETIQIAHCLEQAVDIGLLKDERRQARLDYLEWISLRAVEPLASVDPTFELRLARYLVDFYIGLSRRHAGRGPRERRILHVLLATRVQRLPNSLQSELYRDARMKAFGTSREKVTIGEANFEAGAFWRAVRRALKYGKARLRFRRRPTGRWRLVHLCRDDDDLILRGGIRARIGDALLSIAAVDGDARITAINRVVDDFRLEPNVANRVIAEASAATTVSATVRALRNAGTNSAARRYGDAVTRLEHGERIRIDAFAPAPFGAVLAAIGITDTTSPLSAALQAVRTRAAENGWTVPTGVMGIPVLPAAQDLAALHDVLATSQARTPMAIIHLAAAARDAGRPSSEIAQHIERFLASVERNGRLFLAILRWTHMHFVRDSAWRSAPSSYALAAIWSHADRVLDIAIGASLEPDTLRRVMESHQPQLAGIDLLAVHRGPPDVASPAWMSSAALIHHGLAAIFGSDALRPVLGDALMERLLEAQLSNTGGVIGPEVRLLLRRGDWLNAMGSFLSDSPSDFRSGEFDRDRVCALLAKSGLDAIDASPDDASAWHQVGAFAAGGIDQPSFEKLVTIVSADPARLARLITAGADQMLWRSILQPIAWRDASAAARLAKELAKACRRLDEAGHFDGRSPISAEAAVEEFVELGAVIGACSGDNPWRAFADLLDSFAVAWPRLRPIIHRFAGNLTARSPAGRSHELWGLSNRLASR